MRLLLLTVLTFTFSFAKAQPFGAYIHFDGINDELRAGGYPVPANSDFTIEFWFKSCRDTGNWIEMVVENSSLMNVNILSLDSTLNIHELCAPYNGNNQVCWQFNQFPPDYLWHHIAVTYDYSLDEFVMYFDGNFTGFPPEYNHNYYPGNFLTVGYSIVQPILYDHFRGYIDELRISDTVRYTTSFSLQTTEFIPDGQTGALWHFDDPNPISTVTDYSGNNFDFTASGNPIIIHLDSMIVQNGNILTVSDTFHTYQWIDCATGLPVAGETNPSYLVTNLSGQYAVQVTHDKCDLTSDCVGLSKTQSINDDEINAGIFIYSNPVENTVTIVKEMPGEMQIEFFELSGRLIFSQKLNTLSAAIDISGFAPGVYIVKVNAGEQQVSKKIAHH